MELGQGETGVGLGYGKSRLPSESLYGPREALFNTKKRNVVKEIENNHKEIKKSPIEDNFKKRRCLIVLNTSKEN